jgi:carbon storage regulator
VLSRRPGQGIRIGDTIRVTVVAVDGQFVRLGIEAPTSSKILRDELWRAVAEDNQEAASTAALARAFAQVRLGGPPRAEG